MITVDHPQTGGYVPNGTTGKFYLQHLGTIRESPSPMVNGGFTGDLHAGTVSGQQLLKLQLTINPYKH